MHLSTITMDIPALLLDLPSEFQQNENILTAWSPHKYRTATGAKMMSCEIARQASG